MNSKSLKKAMISINNRNNSKIEKEIKLPKNISNRNNKITNSISFNNSSINASRITSNKLKNHFSLSKNKYPQLKCDNIIILLLNPITNLEGFHFIKDAFI